MRRAIGWVGLAAVLGRRLLMFLVVVGGLTVIVINLPHPTLPEGVKTALVVVWIVLVAIATGWVAWRLHQWWTMPGRWWTALSGALSVATQAASDGWKAVRNSASSMVGWR
jgi:uncharacterized membrane protein HdeD (DUF308 family)